jgi:hypothetical protein
MLFDLRGRGRRRTVQVIYLGLAILIGAGLVLFGVGGAVSGGLLNAVDQNNTSDPSNIYGSRVKSATAKVAKNPQDAAAWATIAKARYQLAGQGSNFSQATSTFTAAGEQQLQDASTAWQRYLALKPAKPDPTVAALMVQAYSAAALNKPDDAVSAYEIYQASRPESANAFAQLAILAYTANQTRKGDLAEQKALSLETDKVARAQLKQNIEAAKLQAVQSAATAAGATTTPATSGATVSP